MPDLSGRDIGRYHLLEQLGEGGMAVVYKAYDTRLEREVAVKIIRSGAFPADALEEVFKRFEREAKSLARLSNPNIVKVHDFGEYEDSPYLVLEYLPGGTLKNMLGKPMAWQDVLRLLLPLARGLDYAHQHGIIHRDIKPSNILITESGEPMLTDFGIAKILEIEQSTALTGSGMAVGTPEYMAPEQWTGTTGQKSDIYSLGIVFYEMVTGRKPYVADTPAAVLIKQATEPFPRPSQFEPNIPEGVERVLLKMLAKNPDDRYADMGEVVRAMDNLLNATASQPAAPAAKVSVAPRPAPAPAPRRSFNPWLLLGGAGIICAALGCMAVFGGSLAAQFWPSASVVPPTSTLSRPVVQPAASRIPSDASSPAPEESPLFFTETFENGLDDWEPYFLGTGNANDATIEMKNGKLNFNLQGKQVYAYYFYRPHTYTGVSLTLQAVNLGRNSNNISLVCNKSGNEWYEFSVGNDGLWYLYYQKQGDYFSIADGGSNAVKIGRELNVYEMVCDANEITLRINGSELKSIIEREYGLKRGQVGINVSSLESVPVVTEIDFLDIQEP
jgi:serine/threonine protein kinase